MANINWQNLPSETTPINSTNLNVMSAGLLNVSNEVDDTYRVNLLKGKNLLSTSLELGTFTNSGVKDTSTINYRTANMVKVKPNTTYTTSINGTAQAYGVYFYTAGGVYISSATTATFTTPANCEYLNFRCFNADFTSDFANLKVQLEEGDTATSYEPYIQNQIVVDNEKYSDTLNVGTSVDSRNRLNVLKSKNLYNYQDANTIVDNVNIIQQTNKITTDNTCKLAYIKCKPSTTYTISRRSPMANRFVIATTSEIPANNVDTLSVQAFLNDTTTSITITTPVNAKYIVMRFINNKTDNNFNTYAQTIQVEEGSTATTYEPYITPSIYVDNEMLVSKNVYSTGEVVIGEWLGKPLYRKVIEITNPTLDAWATVNHNIANMDFGRIVDASITRTVYGTTSYIPIGVSNISAGTLFTCDLQKTIFEYKIAGYTNITNLTAVFEYTKTND